MRATPVGARLAPGVGSGRPHAKAGSRQRILDGELERERIAGLRLQYVLHHDPVRLAIAHIPGGPADEAVDGIAMLGLVQRELVGTAVEVVAPVLEPVRPGNENLSPARWALFAARIPVEDLMSPGRVRAETAAHLVDDDPLAVSCELDVHDRRLPGAARRHIIRSG